MMTGEYEVHSPATKRSVAGELQRLEAECQSAASTQFREAARWRRHHYILGIVTVALSTLAGLAFFRDHPSFGAGASTLAALLAVVLTFMKPIERASGHQIAGEQYLALQNDMYVFREVRLFHACDDQTAILAADEFTKRRSELGKAYLSRRAHDMENVSGDKVADGHCLGACTAFFSALRNAVHKRLRK
ncbi:MAG: SLATT domain-containing protein [Azoarcus sp.]|jgi:hypothetical protein|nr:SLATT domain-containing protein [Azoarcus sp.]